MAAPHFGQFYRLYRLLHITFAKFLVPILNPLTKNEYTVKDSFQFAEEICEQDPTLTMGSLDVDSLFTNIPLDETIDICINQLFENTDTVEGFKKSELKQLLCLATKESYFIFNGLLYKQIDGVAMGSPLGPSLANAFLSYYEKNWLNNCPQGFKPIFYRRYVDDIFLLFKSNDHLKYFQDFLNSCHINMSFSMETEKENKLSFLDVEVIREQGKFTTIVYRKPTFSGVYSNFESFLPSVYQFGMVYTLVYRCFRISSNLLYICLYICIFVLSTTILHVYHVVLPCCVMSSSLCHHCFVFHIWC